MEALSDAIETVRRTRPLAEFAVGMGGGELVVFIIIDMIFFCHEVICR